MSQMLKAPGGRRYGPTALARAGAERTSGERTSTEQLARAQSRVTPRRGAQSSRAGAETVAALAVTPVRRAPRKVHRRRPPSGTVASNPFTGSAQCSGTHQGPIGYRMGRWARLTMTVTVLAACAVVAVTATADQPSPVATLVTVHSGDSLWSIAAQADPGRDPRDVIDEIRTLNQLTGDVLPIGIVLRVPTG